MLIFVFLVEKVDDNDGSKSSSSGRNKRPVTKKVMEYCYEPEMEEVIAICIVMCRFPIFFLFNLYFKCLLSFVSICSMRFIMSL